LRRWRLLWSSLTFSLLLPAGVFAGEQTQNLLIDATYKLLKDYRRLEQKVSRLEKELQELRSLCSCPQKSGSSQTSSSSSLKIIVGTFRHSKTAQRFLEDFKKRTGIDAQVKETTCKAFGRCFVVYALGDYRLLRTVRAQGYRDAFIAQPQAHE
jgi:hypothetical protein